jgi:hypothetical protein
MEQESQHVPQVVLTPVGPARREVTFNYEVQWAPINKDPYGKRHFNPERIRVTVGNTGVVDEVVIWGRQVLKGGGQGQKRIDQRWFRPNEAVAARMPEWVRDAAESCAGEAVRMGWV